MNATPSTTPVRALAARHGLLLLAFVVLGLHGAGYGDWIVDDASITFAYAQNLAEHGEPTNFPGGERVEGYSNPAWMLLFAGLERVGLFHPVATPKVFGFGLTALCLVLVATIVRRGLPVGAEWAAGAFALLLATNTSFVAWSVSGLENPLFGVAILGALLRLVDGKVDVPTGLLLAVVALTRPEGVAYVAVFVALACFVPGEASRRRLFAPTLLVVVVVFVGAAVARWIVFQDVLPNTAYAKLSTPTSLLDRFAWDGRGMRYVREGLQAQGFDVMLAIGLFSLFGPRRRLALGLLGIALVGLAFAAYAGGDWMMEFRFLTPVHAAIAALFGLAVGALLARGPRPSVAFVAVFLVLTCTTVSVITGWPRFRVAAADPTVPASRVVRTAEQARSLADAFELGHVRLVFADIGESSRWGSRHGVEVIDVARLASRVVARLGYGDASRRFLIDGWQPDVVMVHHPWSGQAALQIHPDFDRRYRAVWESDAERAVPTGFYVRRALVEVRSDDLGHRVAGPSVDGITLEGWTAVRGRESGAVALDLAWSVEDASARPALRWQWGEASGGLATAHRIHAEHADRAQGLLRTPVPVLRPSGDLVVTTASGDTIWSLPSDTLRAVARAIPALERDAITAAATRAWAAGDTAAALDVLESVPANRQPIPDGALRSIRAELSRALVPDAAAARRAVRDAADVAPAVRRAERAIRLWPGNTEAMLLLGDLLPLERFLVRGLSDPRAALRGLADPAAVTSRRDLVEGVLRPAAAWHRWRLRDFVPRFTGLVAECTGEAAAVPLVGWLDREDWGRWAVDEAAVVWLDGLDGRTLEIEASPWPAMDRPQQVDVVFEGESLGSFTVEGEAWRPQVFRFDLPADVTCGILRLEFARLYADAPPASRQRALAVQSIELR